MRNAKKLMLMPLALAVSSCACPPQSVEAPTVIEVPPPRLAPPPPSVMEARPSNFRDRLQQIFSTSPTTPTPSPTNFGPANK